jgi:hypothetical protein
MNAMISNDDIFLISQIMNSRNTDEMYGYIDRQTGDVLLGTRDSPLSIQPNEDDDNFEELETTFYERYLPISQSDSNTSYQDMAQFIETVTDAQLSELLDVAIQGRGAFGRFKDVLRRPMRENELARWYEFSRESESNRVIEWLKHNGMAVHN